MIIVLLMICDGSALNWLVATILNTSHLTDIVSLIGLRMLLHMHKIVLTDLLVVL